MKSIASFLGCILVCGGLYAQVGTTTTTTTRTVTTETTVTTKVTKPFMKVAVLDFGTADTIGLKLIGHLPSSKTDNNEALTAEDRTSVNSVMQGFVKLMEVATNNKVRDEKWSEEHNLFNETLKGKARPSILGAEYLSAYLGRHNDVFGVLDTMVVKKAMLKLQKDPEFPKDFMQKLAAETGATHLIFGTVSDIRTKENSFKGYGIETKTTLCQLDVIIKVIDLAAQYSVFSNVYTGSYKEQRPISVEQFDNNIYQNLMTGALEQAAEELYELCKPENPDGIYKPKAVTE